MAGRVIRIESSSYDERIKKSIRAAEDIERELDVVLGEPEVPAGVDYAEVRLQRMKEEMRKFGEKIPVTERTLVVFNSHRRNFPSSYQNPQVA